jgi:hypothetical protein
MELLLRVVHSDALTEAIVDTIENPGLRGSGAPSGEQKREPVR